jgi:hypothetical protein
MTEEEWLCCDNGMWMEHFLRSKQESFRTRWLGWITHNRYRLSERKSRLFAVACVRRVWDLIVVEEARACVEAAERFAEGEIDEAGLQAAIEASVAACDRGRPCGPGVINAVGRVHRTYEAGRGSAPWAAAFAWAWSQVVRQVTERGVSPEEAETRRGALMQAEHARQAGLFRCVVGNPFRPVPAVAPAWLTWHDGLVRTMAQTIYAERRFDEAPVLADALEDAGCGDGDLLGHLRGPGPHCRGCWVPDLLLGKS